MVIGMRFIERLFTRRRTQRRFGDLEPRTRERLRRAICELSSAELSVAARLGLPEPPRLLMVDEETAVVLLPEDRL